MEPLSQQLLEKYRSGDPKAAQQIYDRYAARLLGLARRMLSDRLAARIDPEDVVQSAYRSFFVTARDGKFDIRHSGDLWRLLLAITRHKLLHAAERHTAAKRSPLCETSVSEFVESDASAEDVVALADELADLLRQLDPTARQVLELRLQDRSVEEIAEIWKGPLERCGACCSPCANNANAVSATMRL